MVDLSYYRRPTTLWDRIKASNRGTALKWNIGWSVGNGVYSMIRGSSLEGALINAAETYMILGVAFPAVVHGYYKGKEAYQRWKNRSPFDS